MLLRVLTLVAVLQLVLSDLPSDNSQPETRDIINERDYYFSTIPLSPDDAVISCRDRQMVLTSLETIEESFAVTNYILQNVTGTDLAYWTSGVRIYKNWLWSSTGKPLDYTNLWEVNEPNEPAFPGHACIYLINGKYRDSPCNVTLQFICEQEECI